jgi:hypothetical protein
MGRGDVRQGKELTPCSFFYNLSSQHALSKSQVRNGYFTVHIRIFKPVSSCHFSSFLFYFPPVLKTYLYVSTFCSPSGQVRSVTMFVSTFCSPSGQVRNNSANDWQRRKKSGVIGRSL